ncbi:MAG: DNA topoisomerase I [Bacteroidetes bacterium GWF2_43_63]|nr:MAG: DNA topoisomerase I [Bacteroidetes bacterium GWE2_42_42]OFY55535.1 MAG: DNA topoisomerase I [Bacteroidetes bacterium GWF2_43_63]HBG71545.1 type I DNA topoisomerase [Bacteroidales bacterium]HCB62078.1 type I DNA topoisomerase [Bacteroidales bacterium]HCY22306.1 type I DNA topoisomerase [Bacteroidales bacterium]
MAKNLVIVESPAKAKTIEKFLGKDFQVLSSYGHVRDLQKEDLSIDVKNGFKPLYIILPDKQKIVSELKKLSKQAETTWLATDEDREGEAIAWHLAEALNLDIKKTKRIVFHEITKTAILEAIENPRSLDVNLVDAQQARRVLDRLVGYRLSPLLWKKVKPALSAGRVQSVAVRLIVEREDDINQFTSTSEFRVNGLFEAGKDSLNAELNERFENERESMMFLDKIKDSAFSVGKIEIKPGTRNPAPPFTTSTLQQEAARKLGFSVSQTMTIAQQLYEAGLITYMRTDSVNLSKLAIGTIKEEIEKSFGPEYSKSRQFATKSKGAQEAHEAIRPTYASNREIEGPAAQKKLYELIWKRTVASQMSEAKIERTSIQIDISGAQQYFVARGEVIIFDGFLKVYEESRDDDASDEDKGQLPKLKEGQKLSSQNIVAEQRFSQQPPRYSEASLVKKLEDLGIGRPSTYAPTISTIQRREYVIKESRQPVERKYISLVLAKGAIKRTVETEKFGSEKNKLFPTDLGIIVTKFLIEHFLNIIDYNFTANIEKDFDEIADGKKKWNVLIANFYKDFDPQVINIDKTTGKYHGERLLGVDPATKKNVYTKLGPFGPMAQIGESTDEEKPRFAGLLKGQTIDGVTLEEALALFCFPKILGESDGNEVVVSVGRFGPYVRFEGKFYSIPRDINPTQVNLATALEIVANKQEKDRNSVLKTFKEDAELQIVKGRFGPYIKYKGKNYPLGKGRKYDTLSCAEILEIVKEHPEKPARNQKSAKASKAKKFAVKDKPATKKKATTSTAKKTTAKKTTTENPTAEKTTAKKTTAKKTTAKKATAKKTTAKKATVAKTKTK